jgi:hypothetical protein
MDDPCLVATTNQLWKATRYREWFSAIRTGMNTRQRTGLFGNWPLASLGMVYQSCASTILDAAIRLETAKRVP